MNENEKKEIITTIVMKVQAKNFDREGKLTDTVDANANLIKTQKSREGFVDHESLTFRGGSCGCGKIGFDYNSSTEGIVSGIKNTDLNADIKVKRLDSLKNELIDSIDANTSLTKADAGHEANKKVEDWFHFGVEQAEEDEGCEKGCGCPKINSYYNLQETSK